VALANGTKLGPYEIVAPVGAGGMGEVYRARDTRLDRIVVQSEAALARNCRQRGLLWIRRNPIRLNRYKTKRNGRL
jgi:serine/threonine protein kinase